MRFSYVSELLLLFKTLQNHHTLQQKDVERICFLDGDTINGDSEGKDLAQLCEEYPHVIVSNRVKVSEISNDVAVALAQALRHNSDHGVDLNLSNNNISNDGAVALAQALCHNSNLKEPELV